MSQVILFVYGTLKRGLSNHRLLAGQEYLGEAVSEPRYRLIDLGPYPGLIRDEEHGAAVAGELWEVSECCLQELDDFEGFAYIREPIALQNDSREITAYYWVRPVPTGTPSGPTWPLRKPR